MPCTAPHFGIQMTLTGPEQSHNNQSFAGKRATVTGSNLRRGLRKRGVPASGSQSPINALLN